MYNLDLSAFNPETEKCICNFSVFATIICPGNSKCTCNFNVLKTFNICLEIFIINFEF